jgi:hypothetical protein
MVFPHSVGIYFLRRNLQYADKTQIDKIHPTLEQASHRRWNFSDRDRREMRRIVQMGRRAVSRCGEDQLQRAPRYRELWKRWVEGRDTEQELVVAFA